MANRKWIEDWYLQYLSEINAKKAADEEKAKTTTHPPEGGDNTKVKPDNAVPWQEANTKLPMVSALFLDLRRWLCTSLGLTTRVIHKLL